MLLLIHWWDPWQIRNFLNFRELIQQLHWHEDWIDLKVLKGQTSQACPLQTLFTWTQVHIAAGINSVPGFCSCSLKEFNSMVRANLRSWVRSCLGRIPSPMNFPSADQWVSESFPFYAVLVPLSDVKKVKFSVYTTYIIKGSEGLWTHSW